MPFTKNFNETLRDRPDVSSQKQSQNNEVPPCLTKHLPMRALMTLGWSSIAMLSISCRISSTFIPCLLHEHVLRLHNGNAGPPPHGSTGAVPFNLAIFLQTRASPDTRCLQLQSVACRKNRMRSFSPASKRRFKENSGPTLFWTKMNAEQCTLFQSCLLLMRSFGFWRSFRKKNQVSLSAMPRESF